MELSQLIIGLQEVFESYGPLLVFVASFVEITPLGFAIPGGSILALGGFFSYSSNVSLFEVLLAGWLGAWLTFVLAYFLGQKTGYRLAKALRQEKNAKRAKTLLEKYGGRILTTSMLANLTRFWVAYVAGSQNFPLFSFLRFSGFASLAWSSLMVVVGYLAGSERGLIEKWITQLGILSWVLVFAAIYIIYRSAKNEFSRMENPQKEL